MSLNITMTRILAGALVLVTLAAPAWAGYDDGVAAYRRGDHAAALRALRPLARRGDARALYILGVMHERGHGVRRDHAEAVRWYRKAADQGEPGASEGLRRVEQASSEATASRAGSQPTNRTLSSSHLAARRVK